MKIIYSFLLTFIICMSSCSNYRDCFLFHPPNLHYVGFDSTDFSTVYLKQYKKCCGFDSLISIDTVHYSGLGSNIKDTFSSSEFYLPKGQEFYEYPDYNLKIVLPNNIEIHLSNIQFEKNECGAHETEPEECWCEIKSVEINTINCTNTVGKYHNVFIHK